MQKFPLLAKPAYGRTYEHPDEVLRDWYNGVDFYSLRGYFSIRDKEYISQEFSNVCIQWTTGKEVVVKC